MKNPNQAKYELKKLKSYLLSSCTEFSNAFSEKQEKNQAEIIIIGKSQPNDENGWTSKLHSPFKDIQERKKK